MMPVTRPIDDLTASRRVQKCRVKPSCLFFIKHRKAEDPQKCDASLLLSVRITTS